MKTKLIIEVETKDNITGSVDTGEKDKPVEEYDLTKEVHNDVISCIKNFLDKFENTELPEDFEEGYIEGMDEPKDYGIKFKITKG